MGWKEFAASIVGDILSWPVVVLVVVLLLLKPIRKLIGRTKAAKGFGGEVEFHDLLEATEERVDAFLESEVDTEKLEEPATRELKIPNFLDSQESISEPMKPDWIRDASGAIITAWEQLIRTLTELNRIKARPGRPTRNPRLILDQLLRSESVNRAFYDSAVSLLELRNQVAHGEATPTHGAARTYTERAYQLETAAQGMIAVANLDLDKSLRE